MFKTGTHKSTAQGQTNFVADGGPCCLPRTYFGKERKQVSFYEENNQYQQNQNQQKQQNNRQNQNQNQNQF